MTPEPWELSAQTVVRRRVGALSEDHRGYDDVGNEEHEREEQEPLTLRGPAPDIGSRRDHGNEQHAGGSETAPRLSRTGPLGWASVPE